MTLWEARFARDEEVLFGATRVGRPGDDAPSCAVTDAKVPPTEASEREQLAKLAQRRKVRVDLEEKRVVRPAALGERHVDGGQLS